MAEKPEETPENIEEQAAADESASAGGEATVDETAAAEAAGDEAATTETAGDEAPAAGTDAAPAADETPAAPRRAAPKSGPTRREKLEAKRTERRAAAGKRPSRTPEERAAERAERRAANARQRRAYRARLKTKRADARKAEPAREADHAPEHGPGKPKVRQGVVVSAKPDKSITVRVDVAKRHQRYRKILRTSSTLHVHDESNDAHEGDTVRVVECRPMSRTKRWRLLDVLERAR
jgi:small subunit ribosomal protein S17